MKAHPLRPPIESVTKVGMASSSATFGGQDRRGRRRFPPRGTSRIAESYGAAFMPCGAPVSHATCSPLTPSVVCIDGSARHSQLF